MCDVGYLCANFSLPRPLCSRVRPDVRDRRQTEVRRQTKASLNAPPIRGRNLYHTFSRANSSANTAELAKLLLLNKRPVEHT